MTQTLRRAPMGFRIAAILLVLWGVAGVIACIQQVPGVLALTLTNFQLIDASHGVYQVLPALPARWDRVHAHVRGAQLLTLAPAALTLIAETGDK